MRLLLALRVAAGLWWILLALQIWFAWDLNEFYAACLPLLMMGPETPFALAGSAIGAIGLLTRARPRSWPTITLLAMTLAASLWLLVESPVMWLGAGLYLWRHEPRFLAEVEFARRSLTSGVPHGDLPSHRGVFVEGQPPRFGFEQRWIGAFHWAAFVYDPDRTIEGTKRSRSDIFGYSLLGYDHLWGDWYVVWAMK